MMSQLSSFSRICLRSTQLASSSATMPIVASKSAQGSTTCRRSFAHSVRVILRKDLPNGAGYTDDVLVVKAGYARNYLLPQKYAVYATRPNFEKYNVTDPSSESVEDRRLRLEREASAALDEDLKAYDLLKYYLRNKTVSEMWYHHL